MFELKCRTVKCRIRNAGGNDMSRRKSRKLNPKISGKLQFAQYAM